MSYFLNGEDELNLVKFIAKYQYLSVKDLKYFFSSKSYYRKRITNLVKKEFLRRKKLKFVLGENGIQYSKLRKFEYNPPNRNKDYIPRLLYISNFAAYYNKCEHIKFQPSFAMKDKVQVTTTARRYIGVLDIDGIEYLTYHISKKKDNMYKESVLFDIAKEKDYGNFIILVDDINKYNLKDFAFGRHQVLVIEDSNENREKLKYINRVRWSGVIEDYYDDKVFLAEYRFCDYTDYNNKFVTVFYMLDTEKIIRIKHFIKESPNRTMDIVCGPDLKPILRREIPNANYIVINMDDYIVKEKRVYTSV